MDYAKALAVIRSSLAPGETIVTSTGASRNFDKGADASGTLVVTTSHIRFHGCPPLSFRVTDHAWPLAAVSSIDASRKFLLDRITVTAAGSANRFTVLTGGESAADFTRAARDAISVPTHAAGTGSQQRTIADQIANLAQLHSVGALTEEEFARAKARLLR